MGVSQVSEKTRRMKRAAFVGAMALVGVTAMVLVASGALVDTRVELQDKMIEDMYGEEKPSHVSQEFWHSDGEANHNRFKGVGMGNDAEPDGDAGFPAASFSARAARKSALAEVGAAPVQAAENAGPRKVMGSSALAKMFKSWVDIKLWGANKNIKTSALATKTGSLEAEDEDDTGELVFGFFILFLPLIVLVIVLLVLLPFMIAKANGEPGPSMPSMPSVPGADAAAEHIKSASDMVVKYLSPVEEMSPFQVGQIHKLISDINENAGTAVAPGFIVLQVLFLTVVHKLQNMYLNIYQIKTKINLFIT